MDNYFTIREKLPSLNEVILKNRVNRFAGNTYKHKIQKIISTYIREGIQSGTLHKLSRPCFIDFVWHERTRRRDADNIASAKKFILDEMVADGILIDDSRKYVLGFTDRIVDDVSDYVLVSIKEK